MFIDRRHTPRLPAGEVVSIFVCSGPGKGTTLVGLLHDISQIGYAILIDGQCLTPGTAVRIEMGKGETIYARVCHSTPADQWYHVGFSAIHIVRMNPVSADR